LFFLAVTHRDLRTVIRGQDVSEVVLGDRRVTALGEGPLAALRVSDEGFTIIEAARPSPPGDEATVLSRAVFNRREGMLSVSRLTSGGRPIYYTLTAADEFLCSTHVSMLRRAGIALEENRKALPEFFVYGFVTPSASMFQGIGQVPYGGTLGLDLSRRPLVLNVSQPLELPVRTSRGGPTPADPGASETLDLLRIALSPLAGFGPDVAVLLSGGLDSSILTALGQRLLDISDTYSTGYSFEDAARNIEKDYALSAAEALGTRHGYHEEGGEAYLYGLLETIATVEEPLHSLQMVLMWLLLGRGLPGDKRVVICGQGADGVFGLGMHEAIFRSRQGSRLAWRVASGPTVALARRWARRSRRGEYALSRLETCWRQRVPLTDPRHLIWDLQRYGDPAWVRSYFGVSDHDLIANRLAALQPFADRDLLDLVSILDLAGDVGVVQAQWSKTGEAHGRGVLYPYTDQAVLAHVMSLPWAGKLAEPKAILRGVARQLGVPAFIVERPKSGFGLSPERWALRGGPLEPLVPLASRVVPETVIRQVQTADRRLSRIYWHLLNYAIWRRLVIEGQAVQALKDELALTAGGPRA
jgi:asparagine synthetase B (glutamine-hydrolysing)